MMRRMGVAIENTPGTAEAEHAAAVLERLVALNARRAAEEAAGTIRWLRPDFQDPARRAAREAAAARLSAAHPGATPEAPGAGEKSLLNQERSVAIPHWVQADFGIRTAENPVLEALGRARREGAGWRG